ncbi:MAG: FAD-dependent oxidoreductase [Eubacteriales bacterium]|nr:FAD-dependent oxidoreductase [Eubacteriales bacterium]
MIEIKDIKVPVLKGTKQLEKIIMKKLRVQKLPSYRIIKRSIDARKKDEIVYVYTVGVYIENENHFVKKIKDKNISCVKEKRYQFPTSGDMQLRHSPVVIGAGPAGLFCALILSKLGYAPIVIERGASVDERIEKVEQFFASGILNPECNVQFGEGGAGTFSDGKLNTQVKEKYGRLRYVLETFVKFGASQEILYDNKPHVGTDRLVEVVKGIREEIIANGGSFLFNTKVTDIKTEQGKIIGVITVQEGQETYLECEHVVLAIGHSARDTFEMLYKHDLHMNAKDFAMGVRVEHLASWIQNAMYGTSEVAKQLPAAPYKLTHQTQEGRGVYTFCMCPGGYVVNASSEAGHTAINGMSYSGRDGENSNTALIVTVRKEDYESTHPLAGVQFQRTLEKRFFDAGKGRIVAQRFEDFQNRVSTESFGEVKPQMKGAYVAGNVRECLPDFMADSIEEAILAFGKKIEKYDHKDTVLAGVESRTSSPVRIERGEHFMSNVSGIYPCGEGAGYAGGIVSAAMDGIKVAEAIVKKCKPIQVEELKG